MHVHVRLNHCYRVLDSPTYRALQETAWLGTTFAPRDERTTSRADWSYTGLYLYGEHTYLEFFDDGPQGPPGHAGLAFDLDGGDTPTVADAWANRVGTTRVVLVERPTDGGHVPWFHMACAEPDRHGGMHVWSMEYHHEFLARWRPHLTTARTTQAADVLERYAATVTARPRDEFLLRDVTAIDFSLSREAARFLRGHLEVLVPVDERGAGFSATVGVTRLRATVSEAPLGMTSLQCSLRRAVAADTRTFGRARLRLEGLVGVWEF